MKDKRMLGNAMLLLAAMIWGTAFVAQRVGMDSIEPLAFNAVIAGVLIIGESMSLRELLGCIVMSMAIVMVQIPIPVKKRKVD